MPDTVTSTSPYPTADAAELDRINHALRELRERIAAATTPVECKAIIQASEHLLIDAQAIHDRYDGKLRFAISELNYEIRKVSRRKRKPEVPNLFSGVDQ